MLFHVSFIFGADWFLLSLMSATVRAISLVRLARLGQWYFLVASLVDLVWLARWHFKLFFSLLRLALFIWYDQWLNLRRLLVALIENLGRTIIPIDFVVNSWVC